MRESKQKMGLIRFAKDEFLRNGPVEFPCGSPIQLAKDELPSARMDFFGIRDD